MSISPEMAGWIGLVVLILLMFAGMWVGFAMGLVGFLGFVYLSGLNSGFKVLATVPYGVLRDYNISVIPLFLLMGVIAANTRIGEDLYRAGNAWVGQFRGGLAMATTLACAMFAAICGSSLSEVITMGKVAVPEMKRYKYDDTLATATIAAAGSLAILIPPSMGFIMYAILTTQSVGKLFMAGIFPGILLTVLFIVVVTVITMLKPSLAPPGRKTTFKEKIASLRYTWAMVVLFVLVMGGIYAGIFTPTEGGAIGAFGAIVISIAGRRLTRKNFFASIMETAKTTGMMAALIIGAFIMMRFFAVSTLPFALAEFIASLEVSRYVVFVGIVIIYIIIGMFLDIMGAIILTVPILYPVVLALGFDPIWYGVVMVLLIEMGMITPPFALNVFVLSGTTGIPCGTIFRGVWPYVGAILACVVIITIFPQIALFLPTSM